ncbi:MAG: hypothetical protein ACM3QW_08125 [Ignavibacteriales bacterium]
MFKDDVLARLHLGAILPLLQDIVGFDESARNLVKDWNLAIQFQLPGGDPATVLIFENGQLKTQNRNYSGSKVTLSFRDSQFLNDVFQGRTQKQPSPNVNAIFHLKELKKIDKLLAFLEYYLKPDDTILKNPEIRTFCIMINLYALAFSIKQIGENDPEMIPVAHHLPDGIVEFSVVNGPSVHIKVDEGHFEVERGPAPYANAVLEIKDMDTAWAMIQGNLNMFAAVGNCDLRLKGYIPLLDGINPLIDRMPFYLGS